MAGHTKGPWRLKGSYESNCTIQAQKQHTGANGEPVTYWGDVAKTTTVGDSSVRRANALLIAAAPDLLEAALNFGGLYDTPVERRRRAGDPLYTEAMEQLRATINRARTGEGG